MKKKMSDSDIVKNQPKLKFEDKEYSIDSLPKEGKALVDGLKTAEHQIKLQEDNLKLISFSKAKMFEELKKILKDVEPLNEN